MTQPDEILFTTAERALLRFEFLERFGQTPRLADGMWLRTWKGGPQAGQPKVSPAVASMLARGLVTIDLVRPGARAYFTDAGYAVLRRLAQDRRALNPTQYGHLLEELGLKPPAMATLDDAAEG